MDRSRKHLKHFNESFMKDKVAQCLMCMILLVVIALITVSQLEDPSKKAAVPAAAPAVVPATTPVVPAALDDSVKPANTLISS